MQLDAFIDAITELTPRLCRAILAREQDCLSCDRVTIQEIWALEIIGYQEPCPRALLLKQLRLKPSTGSVFLRRLESSGLIRRFHPKGNRRNVDISLTARGRRAIEQARRHRRSALRLLFEPLPEKDRASYLAMLEALTVQFSP
ncbi:MAG: MarR family transcriptional regulator [Kiritimatiellae bacterium]|nr:MarR family transcriptional regulator [Kiritimatiellia bacterium]MDW8458556.1 MarR family transcriptional regulator [Verrucomicrobiota bacterium]